MNHLHAHKNYIHNLTIVFLLCVGLCSCGLEIHQDIAPPRNAFQPNPADGSTDSGFIDSPENQQFEFTAENLSNVFISPGTDVYYRIYNNIDDLQDDAGRINNANTENTSNGFNALESLGYDRMSSDGNASIFIDGSGGRIIIRLVSDDTGAIYTAGIYVNSTTTVTAIPQRYDREDFNFDPDTATDTPNTLPTEGDSDYDGETSDGKNYWYVNAYAVSTGLNSATFAPVTSEILSLGFIAYSSKPVP